MSLCLLSEKSDRLNTLVTSFSNKVSASKRQVQYLAGSLNFACHVVHGGRTFLCRVIDGINKLRLPSHRSRLSTQFRADLLWRKTFLVTFNGQSMMLDCHQPVYFQTDASFHGFGAVCSDDWFAGSWSDCPAPDVHSSAFRMSFVCGTSYHEEHYISFYLILSFTTLFLWFGQATSGGQPRSQLPL